MSGLRTVDPYHFGLHSKDTRTSAVTGRSITPFPQLGQRTARLWDVINAWWNYVEVSDGVFDWTIIEQAVTIMQAAGCRLIGNLGNPPLFVSGGTQTDYYYNPNPPDMTKYQRWCEAYFQRLGARLWAVEATNEPTLGPSLFWNGTTAQLIQMAQILKQARDSYAPQVKIISPPITSGSSGLQMLNAMLAAGIASYSDYIGCHLYPGADEPESIIQLARQIKATCVYYGCSLPIANTEFGYFTYYTSSGTLVPAFDNVQANSMPDAQGASFVSRMLMISASLVDLSCYFCVDEFEQARPQLLDYRDRTTILTPGRAFAYVVGLLGGGKVSSVLPYIGKGPGFSMRFETSARQPGTAFWISSWQATTADLTGFSRATDLVGVPISISTTTPVTMSPIFAFR